MSSSVQVREQGSGKAARGLGQGSFSSPQSPHGFDTPLDRKKPSATQAEILCVIYFQKTHHIDPLLYMTEWFMCLLARLVSLERGMLLFYAHVTLYT